MKQKYKYSKKENLYLWHRTRWELSQQLVSLRLEKQLSVLEVNQITRISCHTIDNLETGRGDLSFQYLMPLAFFYGKRVKITLEDPVPSDFLATPPYSQLQSA